MDAEVRPHIKIPLPLAELYGRTRLRLLHAAPPRSKQRRRARTHADVGLSPTLERDSPEARIEKALEVVPELRDGYGCAEIRQARRRHYGVHSPKQQRTQVLTGGTAIRGAPTPAIELWLSTSAYGDRWFATILRTHLLTA